MSKIARSYSDKHGLKDLIKEFIGLDVSKQLQTSDFGGELSEKQLQYCAKDVIYLHKIYDGLKNILKRDTNFEFSSSNPMWRATLETLDFLPLTTVDYSGGTIITDWYSTSGNEKERCKLNIFITGINLKTENLRVVSFCQEFKNPTWVNKETEKENNIKIENAILKKAKKLKLQSS